MADTADSGRRAPHTSGGGSNVRLVATRCDNVLAVGQRPANAKTGGGPGRDSWIRN